MKYVTGDTVHLDQELSKSFPTLMCRTASVMRDQENLDVHIQFEQSGPIYCFDHRSLSRGPYKADSFPKEKSTAKISVTKIDAGTDWINKSTRSRHTITGFALHGECAYVTIGFGEQQDSYVISDFLKWFEPYDVKTKRIGGYPPEVLAIRQEMGITNHLESCIRPGDIWVSRLNGFQVKIIDRHQIGRTKELVEYEFMSNDRTGVVFKYFHDFIKTYKPELKKMPPLNHPYFAWSEAEELLNHLCDHFHTANREKGWYSNPKTGEREERNIGELLALIHSEVSEALEAFKHDAMDDKVPELPGITVESADILIRVFDMIGYLRFLAKEKAGDITVYDGPNPGDEYALGTAVVKKATFNYFRKDHTLAERAKENGKKF